MAYTFNQKNWVAGEVITANGVNRIEECLGHLVDEKQNILYFDAVPTAGSQNLVNSGGIYNALKALDNFIIDRRPTPDSRNAVQSRGIYEALLGKQDLLIFDSTPKSSSSNPVTSQGIYQALNLKQNNLTFDSTPISNSNNPVTSKGIYQALSLKQDNLTFDNTPNSGSNNPVTSNGIYRALSLKQNNLTFDSTPILNSSNPVTSEGIYISLQNLLGEVNNSLDDLNNSFYQELITKQNKLTFDNTPKNNSNNPVTSNGIYDALQEIELKIPNAQVQSDWNITDSASKAYIKNKPSLGTAAYKNIPSSGNASSAQVVLGNDTRLTDSRNAKDVYSWAKQPEKPTYSYEEIIGSPIQVQSDWEEEDTESKAYIKNRPIIPNSKQQYLLENIYSNSYGNYNDIKIWSFRPSISTQLPLIVGKKYKIQINDNIYEEYFQYSTSNKCYYFVGSFSPYTNIDEITEKGFAIQINKINENSFTVKSIHFKERAIQKFSITISELLIGKQYLDMPDWSKELTKPNYSYNELTDLPIIPTKTSQLTNDSGFLTIHQDISGKADKTTTVSNVAYNTTNKKITKTINGTTSDVVSVATLKTDMSLNNVENKSSSTIRSEITSKNVTDALGFTPLNEALRGVSGGVATLDENGIVPSSQLPAYVDTILVYNSLSNFPSAGEPGKIYVALDTNKSYRWSGTQYTEISSSISLGEVQGTAYEGHKGKANALAINDLQNNKANKSTTISGYGIIDAKIENGIITLGNNTIQPIVDNNYNHTDNNFTNEEKNKLAQINTEAEKNIQSDWNITDINSDAYIKNKPNITNTITENNNSLVTSGAIYTELIKKQNNLINVPKISEIRPTDYIYIERNRTIYKILASKLGTFTPDESDPNAIETNNGNIITDENGNEIIIDNNSGSDPNVVETNNGNVILDENGNEIIINTNTTDTVVTNDGKIILTEDQRELNLG